jgi:hypothetical protein
MQHRHPEGEAKMPLDIRMQVDIQDDAENWRRWGDLVRSWIFNKSTRPKTGADMQAQMNTNDVVGQVPDPARNVEFVDYDDDKLYIPLPSETMVLNDEALLRAIAARPPGERQYPLPNFYAFAFGGATEVDLSENEMLALGRRRLGEYTIQECQ